jgi:hypothetical protein
LAVVAALFGTRKVEMITQQIEQARPRRHPEPRLDAIYDQRQWDLFWYWHYILAQLWRIVRVICFSARHVGILPTQRRLAATWLTDRGA